MVLSHLFFSDNGLFRERPTSWEILLSYTADDGYLTYLEIVWRRTSRDVRHVLDDLSLLRYRILIPLEDQERVEEQFRKYDLNLEEGLIASLASYVAFLWLQQQGEWDSLFSFSLNISPAQLWTREVAQAVRLPLRGMISCLGGAPRRLALLAQLFTHLGAEMLPSGAALDMTELSLEVLSTVSQHFLDLLQKEREEWSLTRSQTEDSFVAKVQERKRRGTARVITY